MSQVLGATLVVLKLTAPHRPRSRPIFPDGAARDGLQFVSRALREAAIVERWGALRARCGAAPLEVLFSSPSVSELVAICQEPGTALVVMPAALGHFAHGATGLAARARVPVLLAHAARSDERVVVASNFEDPRLPVVREAARLAERLDAPLTVVHNVAGFSAQLVAAGAASGMPLLPTDDAELARERARSVSLALAALDVLPDVSVTSRLDPVTGILEEAARADADLVVVGVRRQAGARRFASGVPERVCAAAAHSVLLVPI